MGASWRYWDTITRAGILRRWFLIKNVRTIGLAGELSPLRRFRVFSRRRRKSPARADDTRAVAGVRPVRVAVICSDTAFLFRDSSTNCVRGRAT